MKAPGDLPTVNHTGLCRHTVQLYGAGDERLVEGVSKSFAEGLAAGEGALAIATREHREAFLRGLEKLGIDTAALEHEGRVVLADASECLALILRDGEPDATRFEEVVGGLTEKSVRKGRGRGLRAYGEMVGLLWTAGRKDAALRLENLWNDFLDRNSYTLLCGYPIDVFSPDFALAGNVLSTHGRLLPSDEGGRLNGALNRALGEMLGNKLPSLRAWMPSRLHPDCGTLPGPEADILWLRTNLPVLAPRIMERARQYYFAALESGASSSPLPGGVSKPPAV